MEALIEKKDVEQKETNKRNSSIELLKIVAMILIVLSHSIPMYGDKNSIAYIQLGVATRNITEIILVMFKYCGHLGNVLFVISSTYFLLDNNKTKKEKIFNIIFDSFTISIGYLIIVLLQQCRLSPSTIMQQFMPITFGKNWFVGCYLILYIIHPFLNIIIHGIERKTLFRLNIASLLFYGLVQLFLKGVYYYSYLIGFIIIYFYVGYMKLYMKDFSKKIKLNALLAIIGALCYFGMILVINYLGVEFNIQKKSLLYWNDLSNVFLPLCGICLFNVFNSQQLENKIINRISSVSLIFYLIHENILFADNVRYKFYEYIFTRSDYVLFWVIIEAIIMFVFGIAISLLYQATIQKLVHKISKKTYILVRKYYLKFEQKVLHE